MSSILQKSESNGSENSSPLEERQQKINEIRRLLGPLPEKLAIYCSDASISRYLRARNWNVKKATKMLKETLKWRRENKPEEIRWDEVANEAETGKIYRANYNDKHGRSVLVMRPGCQNTKSTKGQIKYLVYCMENAILNLSADQEQMVWLIDFQGFSMGNLSVKITRETAHVLQDHYPERLGLAILYNPPKIFESFWIVVKPFLESKTYRKVKFVYSDDPNTKQIMEDLFDIDKLESAFGGNSLTGFNVTDYSERMKEDDKKMPLLWTKQIHQVPAAAPSESIPFNTSNSESDSDDSAKEDIGSSSPQILASTSSSEDNLLKANAGESSVVDSQSGVETINLEDIGSSSPQILASTSSSEDNLLKANAGKSSVVDSQSGVETINLEASTHEKAL